MLAKEFRTKLTLEKFSKDLLSQKLIELFPDYNVNHSQRRNRWYINNNNYSNIILYKKDKGLMLETEKLFGNLMNYYFLVFMIVFPFLSSSQIRSDIVLVLICLMMIIGALLEDIVIYFNPRYTKETAKEHKDFVLKMKKVFEIES